ncbi:MAG: hypothetical protein C0631_18525 [Sedimenticola sp.]|nr:MAG: hypothetical protein C0631_18525 [Sedimenticola sp.]
MDQDAFRKTYREINERACVFEKSILSGLCKCSQSERFCLAEREGVHCNSDTAQQQCSDFVALLREQSRFALKSNQPGEVLSHVKTMRIQVGGMRGLYTLLHEEQPLPLAIEDIHGLLNLAIEAYESLDKIPLQPVIQQIAAYKGRRRRFDK